jgi:uncharacterized RDD family membrane protein YckC
VDAHPSLPLDDLVVATPERVAFTYTPAGIGTRFVAQLVDLVLLGVIAAAALIALLALAQVVPAAGDAVLIAIVIGAFVLLWGYFAVLEGLWSGQTPGKRLMRLRVVGVRGEPVTFTQAAIRNVIRIVDFLPSSYALGAVVMFISARSQRLGDMAAGTVVVRERKAIGLRELLAMTERAETPVPTTPATPAAGVRVPPRLTPELRRFVHAYAGRRDQLLPAQRERLAAQAEPGLRAALPEVVAERGALAALDALADDVLNS